MPDSFMILSRRAFYIDRQMCVHGIVVHLAGGWVVPVAKQTLPIHNLTRYYVPKEI